MTKITLSLLLQAIQLVLADPPYSIPRVRKDEQSAYDGFTAGDMKDAMLLCEVIMKAGAHVHMFCSALQFSHWYQYLMTKKVAGDETDEWMANDMKVESTNATESFSIECIPLLYSRAPGSYNQLSSARDPHHINIMERTVNFWRSVSDWESVLYQHIYKGRGDTTKTHPLWTNVMNNIGHVSLEENTATKDKTGP